MVGVIHLAAAAMVALAVAADTSASATKSVDRLAWLAGCWEAASGDSRVEEQWMAPRGGTMLGMSRTVRGGALVAHEWILIRDSGEELAYVAHPSGQATTEFRSTTVATNTVVFENKAHDFPQRVGYQRDGASLLAWIEGTKNGKSRRIEFPYRRTACPAD